MAKQSFRVWFVKYGEKGVYLTLGEVPHFDDYFMISPEHCILHTCSHREPSQYLYGFAGVCSLIYGDAMFIREVNGQRCDIEENFESLLPSLMVKDMEARYTFTDYLSALGLGAHVIYLDK